MKRFIKNSLFLITILLLSACATNPATVDLDPQPNVQPINIGEGKHVAVAIIDARPQGVEASYAAAKIDPSQNVSQIFSNQINNGLMADNFVTVPGNIAASSVMQVKILMINYGATTGMAASSTKTEVAVAVTVTNSSGTFHKTYHASSYSDNYLMLTQDNASVQVNLAVNSLFENMLHDQSLLHFLASGN